MNEEKANKYFKMVHDNIEKYGFHITYVMEAPGITPFGYSTGIFKNYGIPELFISGLPNGLTNTLINNYVDRFKFQQVTLNEKIGDLTDRFPVYFVPVKNDNLKGYTLSTFKFYEQAEFNYLQLIFPDLNGLFPHEDGYDYDQKLLGE